MNAVPFLEFGVPRPHKRTWFALFLLAGVILSSLVFARGSSAAVYWLNRDCVEARQLIGPYWHWSGSCGAF
jgi:hypothetical protein